MIPDYADGLLGPAEAARVEAHLKKCRSCAAGLEDYRAYAGQMRGLARVKAPDGFMKELHERLGTAPGKRGFIERIFYPLKIKLPLEAAGLAAACAVMVIFFDPFGFRRSPERIAPVSQEGSDIIAEEKAGKRSSPSVNKRRAGSREKGLMSDVIASRKRAMSKKSLGGKAVRDLSKMESDNDDRAVAEEERVEYQEVALIFDRTPASDKAAGKLEMKKKDDSFANEGASGAADMKDTAKRERKSMKRDSAPGYRNAASACNRVADIASSVNGKILKSEESGGTCKTVILEIPVKNYGLFMEKMRVIGGKESAKNVRQLERALKKQQVPVRVDFILK